jgi:hypothetical protein
VRESKIEKASEKRRKEKGSEKRREREGVRREGTESL